MELLRHVSFVDCPGETSPPRPCFAVRSCTRAACRAQHPDGVNAEQACIMDSWGVVSVSAAMKPGRARHSDANNAERSCCDGLVGCDVNLDLQILR